VPTRAPWCRSAMASTRSTQGVARGHRGRGSWRCEGRPQVHRDVLHRVPAMSRVLEQPAPAPSRTGLSRRSWRRVSRILSHCVSCRRPRRRGRVRGAQGARDVLRPARGRGGTCGAMRRVRASSTSDGRGTRARMLSARHWGGKRTWHVSEGRLGVAKWRMATATADVGGRDAAIEPTGCIHGVSAGLSAVALAPCFATPGRLVGGPCAGGHLRAVIHPASTR